jgi:hypothetical protein
MKKTKYVVVLYKLCNVYVNPQLEKAFYFGVIKITRFGFAKKRDIKNPNYKESVFQKNKKLWSPKAKRVK